MNSHHLIIMLFLWQIDTAHLAPNCIFMIKDDSRLHCALVHFTIWAGPGGHLVTGSSLTRNIVF